MLHSCSRTGSFYPEHFAVESWDTGRGGNVMMLLVYAEGKKTKLDGVSKWSSSVEKFGLVLGGHLQGRGLSDFRSR